MDNSIKNQLIGNTAFYKQKNYKKVTLSIRSRGNSRNGYRLARYPTKIIKILYGIK